MAKSKKKTPAKKAPAKKAKTAVRKSKVTPAKTKVKKPATPKTKAKVAPKAAKPAKAVKPTKATGKKSSPAKAKKTTKAAPAAPAVAKPRSQASPTTMEKTSKKNALRTSILARKASAKPIGFTLDEVRAIAKTNTSKSTEAKPTAKGKATAVSKALAAAEKPAKPNHVKAASLADILGFSPGKRSTKSAPLEKPVPEKFKRFHKLLLDLREHLTGQIDQHSEETLKRSSKDDAGDLSSYGQHMADAGTDTFDRDFALSLVSSEQEALAEIEAAIKRIHDGTYGVCEITGKPIAKDRLLAVPFTRYSAEAQKEIERNRHRVRTQAGLFSEHGDDAGKMMDVDDSGD
ncbi:MAG: TraR/DksA C4-type zinc finger protein [Opitutaceae bacterium]|nr:TraR/DksA C4-type zinc finger protein [Cephaloticoccus sp.]MCP5530839.1 TraR/DksA C4-type zinc finger protein [Opitutaceae bacterium]